MANKAKSLDFDKGAAVPTRKQAETIEYDEEDRNTANRASSRGMDRDILSTPGIHHRTAEAAVNYPQDANKGVAPRKQRAMAGPGQNPTAFSGRQRDARSKTSAEARRAAAESELKALRNVTSAPQAYRVMGDLLSQYQGDTSKLSEETQREIRRIDAIIRRYERRNDRGHVVWVNTAMPSFINHHNLDGFMDGQFEPGTSVEFDRYTMGAHDASEAMRTWDDPAGRRVMLQIQTRRGMYLGDSSNGARTTHMLPRALPLIITDTEKKNITHPDGSTQECWVISMTDDPDPKTD